MAQEAADLIIGARWVIPIEPVNAVFVRHAVVVRGGRIVAFLPMAEARRRFAAASQVSLERHVLLPGLVNLHTHAAMTLFRGLSDDLPLMTWLREHIWPAERRFVSEEFVHDGTLLAAAEMIRSGVTCFNDMYFFPGGAARAVGRVGMRAVLGVIVLAFPTAWAGTEAEYFERGAAVRSANGNALLRYSLAPHAPYTVDDAAFARVRDLSVEWGAPVHVHLQETRHEVEESVQQYGVRPLARLDRLGLVNERLLAVHAVHLSDQEIALLAERGAHVAHCPSANLKLASGIAPVGRLLAAGANVGVGTDGAASNNRLDVLAETRLAALLAKAACEDASAVPAHEALRMATIRPARALGLEGEIGSLVPGKSADLTAIEITGPELEPCYDPASHVVYAAGREHVTHVWVAGRPLLTERRLETIDLDQLREIAERWQERIRET
ncbi:MAG TPA: TRZ/ATZ family hydrolase [Gemmatimonadales bacterium]|nr:TRZ/ATZ family hydrolase [Gemmatimonadales bacterium]